MSKINGWTALVVVAGIAGTVLLVVFKADPAVVAGYAATFIGLAGALEKLLPGASS